MKTRVAVVYSFHDRDWHGGRNYFGSLFRAAVESRRGRLGAGAGHRNAYGYLASVEFPGARGGCAPGTGMDAPSVADAPSWLARFHSDPLLAGLLRRLGIDVLSHSGQVGPRPLLSRQWIGCTTFSSYLPEYWEARHIRWAEQRFYAACRNCDALVVSSNQALADLETFAPWVQASQECPAVRLQSGPVLRIVPAEALRVVLPAGGLLLSAESVLDQQEPPARD